MSGRTSQHSSRESMKSEKTAADNDSVESAPIDTPEPKRAVTGWRWILLCIGLYCACFLYGLDNTIAADIQGNIVETFGNVGQLAWIGTGFPLGSTATILTFGKAYGIFNVKWLHFSSVVVFVIGSAICGAAPTMDALIVGRVIAGAGGAGLYLGLLNLIAINTLEKERPTYIGITGFVWGVGTILGPVIGGAFASSAATWRWAFYINLLIFAILIPALLCLPSHDPKPGVSTTQKLKELDWVGAVLNAGLFTTFLMALTFGGVTWAWNDPREIVMLVVCFVLAIVFVLQQVFAIGTTKERRLFPVQFVLSRTMLLSFIGTAANNTGIFVVIYYVPLIFQFSRGDDGIQSAVRLLPFIIPLSFFIVTSGHILNLVKYYFSMYIFAGSLVLVGSALMYTVTDQTSLGAIYAYEVLIALGAGVVCQIGYSIGTWKASEEMAAAISFINMAQIGGTTIALAISGAVFQNITYLRLAALLQPLGYDSDQIHSAVAGSQSAVLEQVSDSVRQAATSIIVRGISDIYALVITAGAITLICGVLFKKEKMVISAAVAAL